MGTPGGLRNPQLDREFRGLIRRIREPPSQTRGKGTRREEIFATEATESTETLRRYLLCALCGPIFLFFLLCVSVSLWFNILALLFSSLLCATVSRVGNGRFHYGLCESLNDFGEPCPFQFVRRILWCVVVLICHEGSVRNHDRAVTDALEGRVVRIQSLYNGRSRRPFGRDLSVPAKSAHVGVGPGNLL